MVYLKTIRQEKTRRKNNVYSAGTQTRNPTSPYNTGIEPAISSGEIICKWCNNSAFGRKDFAFMGSVTSLFCYLWGC